MTRQRKIAWLSLIPVVVLAAGIVASFVRVQSHAEDTKQHLTRHELQDEFVPRLELDHRLDAQMQILTIISDDVKELKQDLRELD